jgi:hypothetical protein
VSGWLHCEPQPEAVGLSEWMKWRRTFSSSAQDMAMHLMEVLQHE